MMPDSSGDLAGFVPPASPGKKSKVQLKLSWFLVLATKGIAS